MQPKIHVTLRYKHQSSEVTTEEWLSSRSIFLVVFLVRRWVRWAVYTRLIIITACAKISCSCALPSCTDICSFHIPWCNGTCWDEEQHPGRVAAGSSLDTIHVNQKKNRIIWYFLVTFTMIWFRWTTFLQGPSKACRWGKPWVWVCVLPYHCLVMGT